MQFGQHEYIDLSDLNAKWDQALPAVAGLGSSNGSLSGNSLGITGLGDSGFTTEQIMEAQDRLNGALAPAGYKQIKVDGTFSPSTCGAIKWYQDNVNPQGGVSFAAACESVVATAPTKVSSSVVTRSSTVSTRTPVTSRASMGGMGGTNWLLWGGAVAAVAVGGAMIFRASKKR
jgi:hypothetical protein